MFTHWSPMRSACGSRAAARRRPAGRRPPAPAARAATGSPGGPPGSGRRSGRRRRPRSRRARCPGARAPPACGPARDDEVERAERLRPRARAALLEVRTRRLWRAARQSAELARDVVLRALVVGFVKILSVTSYSTTWPVRWPGRRVELDREERRHVGHARRLLHVVRDDDDRVVSLSSSIRSSMRPVEIGSSAEHGSSISSTSGSVASARAMHRRCCWPPDIPNALSSGGP